jgi:peptide/nickel transport system substrate-binding protein
MKVLKITLAVLVLLAAGLFAGCGGSGAKDDDAATGLQARAPASGSQRPGGTLTVLSNEDVDSIDPGISWDIPTWALVSYATQRQLFQYKPDDPSKLAPDLAASDAQFSADNRTVTVKLKPDVEFSPPVSRPVTSSDVRYAIERGFNRNVANPYAPTDFIVLEGADAFMRGQADHISGIETPDDTTVVFKLTRPTAGNFVGVLTEPLASPVPADYAKPFDAKNPSTYGEHQVATGPYMIANDASGTLTGYTPSSRIELVRNPNWKRSTDFRPAYVDKIVERLGNADPGVASRQILEGDSMVNGNFNAPADVLQKAIGGDQKAQVAIAPTWYERYVTLNMTRPPFDDINVRKAVLAAFDRRAMWLTHGGQFGGAIANHFIPPGMPGFEEAGGRAGTGVDFLAAESGDMDLATQYMRKAGFPSGRYTGGKRLFMVGVSDQAGKAEAETAKAQFAKLGFEVDLRLMTKDTMYNKYCNLPRAGVDMCPAGWSAAYNDADNELDPTFSGDQILQVGNANYAELDDPAINTAIRRANETTDPAERAKRWGEVDRMIVAQAPAVPWIWQSNENVRSRNVVGTTGVLGYWDLTLASVR